MHPTRRGLLLGFLVGALVVSDGWGVAGRDPDRAVPPSPPVQAAAELPAAAREAVAAAQALGAQAASDQAIDPLIPPDLSVLQPLPAGQFLVGAAVTSIAPDPSRWQTEGCSELLSNFPEEITHLAGQLLEGELPLGWPRSPDCIYLGGYGIGPARAATSVDPHAGVHVRSIAISNGLDTVIWQTVDLVGFFNRYRSDLCDGCGILDIRRRIAASTGLPVANIATGSTHTHGGPDGYGAWGGLPRWYREQLRDRVVASAFDALRAMRPAAITIGSAEFPSFSRERRDTYYSAADYGAVWLQARGLQGGEHPGQVIATLVNYAAHPVVLGAQAQMHGDWPATASKALGDQLGGVGLVVEGGLGNVSPRIPGPDVSDDDYEAVIQMGERFAAAVAAGIARGGHQLASNVIAAAETTISHPASNWLEVGLAVGGLLDREFVGGDGAGGPGTYTWTKNDSQGLLRPCVTASPTTVRTQVSAYRVGELRVVTGPGELFSTMTNVVKSRASTADTTGGGTVMVFAQTQDSLGYIIQSFEVDPLGGVTTNVGVGEYEETFMLDRCFGDHVLATQLDLLAELG
ncbi:MAG: hypothetical protein ACRD0U_13135 [Acidimicrobiales bacterium]